MSNPYAYDPTAPPSGFGVPPDSVQSSLAGMGSRLGARILDAIIIGIPALIVIALLAPSFRNSTTTTTDQFGRTVIHTSGSVIVTFLLTFIVIAILAAVYEITMIGKRGATLGKQVVGIKVINENGNPVTMGQSGTRWAVYYLPAIIPIIGGFWALLVAISPFFNGRKQGFHDRAAHTLVVRR